MTILGIDTSGLAASVGLYDGEKMLADITLIHERTHSEKIMEAVDKALKLSGLSIKDVDEYAVVCGPGSFTGLRIGTACVKGLAQPEGKKVYKLSSLDVIYECANVQNGLPVCAMTDAGRQEVYCAVYEQGKKVLDDTYMDVAELTEKIKKNYEKALFTGDGMIKYKAIISSIFEGAVFADKSYAYGNGAAVIRAALEFGQAEDADGICPVYLKKPQAERVRDAAKKANETAEKEEENTERMRETTMSKGKIVLACDHGGYELKEYLKKRLIRSEYEVADVGCHNTDSVDYPDYAEYGAEKILSGECKFGIFICGTGIGISMSANKINGIRAAVCTSGFTARAARAHNNANVLCLGGRVLGNELAYSISKSFLEAQFEGGRHERRVDKMAEIEKKQRK